MSAIGPIWKSSVKLVDVPAAKVLDLFGFNSKEFYDLAYWRVQKWQKSELGNEYYEGLFTDWIGLTKDHYKDKSVLDIGCGPRGSLEWADNTKERIGLDSLVDSYKKLGIGKHKMSYVQAGAENMPFEDGRFDIVTSFNSLDHVEDVQSVVREVNRVLSPGGEFIIVVEIHARPTIAEPVVLPWNFLDGMRDMFEFEVEEHLAFNLEFGGASAALKSRIPRTNELEDGVVLAIAKKKIKLAS